MKRMSVVSLMVFLLMMVGCGGSRTVVYQPPPPPPQPAPQTYAQPQPVAQINPAVANGLDLQSVIALAQTATSAQDLEFKLNDQTLGINNVSLSGNGNVDYIQVVESVNGYNEYFKLIDISVNPTIELATLQVTQQGRYATVAIQGNPYYYGLSSFYTTSVLWNTWGFLNYLYGPRHVVYVSPYGYHNLPSTYHVYHSVPTTRYQVVTKRVITTSKVQVQHPDPSTAQIATPYQQSKAPLINTQGQSQRDLKPMNSGATIPKYGSASPSTTGSLPATGMQKPPAVNNQGQSSRDLKPMNSGATIPKYGSGLPPAKPTSPPSPPKVSTSPSKPSSGLGLSGSKRR